MKSEEKRSEELINKLYILGEPIRMQIMRVICERGSLRAVDILDEFTISQPTLSHHMNLLLDADLVINRKDGRSIWYSINGDTINEVIAFISELKEKPSAASKATGRRASVSPGKPVRKVSAVKKSRASDKPALKNDSSVPKPKNKIEVPDIEELKKKKEKKKKKDDKKKKDKDKKKKK